MEQNKRNVFNYKYSAPTEEERRQIESIRNKYAPKDKTVENALEKIKTLDKKIRTTANGVSIGVGTVGCLIFGLGLSLILEQNIHLWGTLISAIGCFPMIFAYPLYNFLIKKGKKKYGDEILRLSDELLNKKP